MVEWAAAWCAQLMPNWNDHPTHMNTLITAALSAVDPYTLVADYLTRNPSRRPTWVLALGKGAGRMAQAAETHLGERLQGGLVITKPGHPGGQTLETVYGGHPTPDHNSLAANERLKRLLDAPKPAGDRWLVLISGGGSALLSAPVAGLSLTDLQITSDALLASGATINEINAVRKHLSRVKGGQLAHRLYPTPVTVLVLSDVIGNPLDVIASGPLSPDPTTFDDCAAILSRYRLWEQLPARVTAFIRAGQHGARPETPKPGDRVFTRVAAEIIGDVGRAATAAAHAARALGFRTTVVALALTGEARRVGEELTRTPRAPGCYLWGGETTVTLGDHTGAGGRNQELALAAGIGLQGRAQTMLFTLATDGGDGPTDAAGARVDGETVARATALGLDATDHLDRHDAYPLFAALGDLVVTGPTGTNVNDITAMMVYD